MLRASLPRSVVRARLRALGDYDITAYPCSPTSFGSRFCKPHQQLPWTDCDPTTPSSPSKIRPLLLLPLPNRPSSVTYEPSQLSLQLLPHFDPLLPMPSRAAMLHNSRCLFRCCGTATISASSRVYGTLACTRRHCSSQPPIAPTTPQDSDMNVLGEVLKDVSTDHQTPLSDKLAKGEEPSFFTGHALTDIQLCVKCYTFIALLQVQKCKLVDDATNCTATILIPSVAKHSPTTQETSITTGTNEATAGQDQPSKEGDTPPAAPPLVAGWIGWRNKKVWAIVRCKDNDLPLAKLEHGIQAQYAKDRFFHVLTCDVPSSNERDEKSKALAAAIDRIVAHRLKPLWTCVNEEFYPEEKCWPLRFKRNDVYRVLRPAMQTPGEIVTQNAVNFQDPGEAHPTEAMPRGVGSHPDDQPFPRLFLVPGASGVGKTMAAVTMPNSACTLDDKKAPVFGAGALSIPLNRIFGIFLVVSWLEMTEAATDDLARKCASEIHQRIKSFGTQFTSDDKERALFYIVLDEMGSMRGLVRKVLADGNEFDLLVRKSLRALLRSGESMTFTEAQCDQLLGVVGQTKDRATMQLELAFAVVGTGVGAAPTEGMPSSLPKTYVIVRSKPLTPRAVFMRHMHVHADAEDVAEIARLVDEDLLCRHLLSNARCAAYMAKTLSALMPTMGNSIDSWQCLMQPAALSVSRHYFETNAWQGLGQHPEAKYRLCCMLVSLTATQRYGYHLLSANDVRTLREGVGAMEDLLQYRTEKPTAAPRTHAHYDEVGASPLVPEYTPQPNSGTTGDQGSAADGGKPPDPLHGSIPEGLRFEVNPAVLIIALLQYVDKEHGALQGSPSNLYEVLVAQYHVMLLDAWRYFFLRTKDNLGVWKLRAALLFPSLANDSIELTLRGTVTVPDRKLKLLWPEGPSLDEMMDRVEEIAQRVATHGTVFELAGDGTARNGIQLFTEGATIGLECTNYRAGDYVNIDTLRKRCFDMGYEQLQLRIKDAEDGAKKDANAKDGGKYVELFEKDHPSGKDRIVCYPKEEIVPHFVNCEFAEVGDEGVVDDNKTRLVVPKEKSGTGYVSLLRHRLIDFKLSQKLRNATNNSADHKTTNNANNKTQEAKRPSRKQAMILVSPHDVMGKNTEITFQHYKTCEFPDSKKGRGNSRKNGTYKVGKTVRYEKDHASVTNERWSLDMCVSRCVRKNDKEQDEAQDKVKKEHSNIAPEQQKSGPGTAMRLTFCRDGLRNFVTIEDAKSVHLQFHMRNFPTSPPANK